MTDPEEIGRHMVAISTSGLRLWARVRILRSLGVLVEHESMQ